MTDRERAANETHGDRVKGRHTNREILKYRKERESKNSGDLYLTDGWLHLGNS